MKTKNNIVTEGLSGSFLQFVFSQRGGDTFVGKRPVRTKPPSAGQLEVISTFKDAVTYAKAVMLDAAKKLFYQGKAKPRQTAYNLALADYFKSPVISNIDTSGYNGQVGSTVIMRVTDNFKVEAVKVRIEKANGTLLEEGTASLLPNGLDYMYVSTVANSTITGTKVIITATDMPGNNTVNQSIL